MHKKSVGTTTWTNTRVGMSIKRSEKMRSLLLIPLFTLLSISAFSATIHTGPGEKVRTIKEAIQIAQPHDTIFVRKALYREGSIEINKPLVLIGENYPTIDGEQKYENFVITSDSVVIQGFKVVESATSNYEDYAGIKISNSKYITIRDNQLVNTFFGILSHYSTHCIIENNILTVENPNQKKANGIHSWKCDSFTIINNSVSGHRDGIYLEFVTNSIIDDNQSFDNSRYGLHFMFSHDNGYHYNTIRTNGAGVAVMYSKRVTMVGNRFSNNWGNSAYAILLKDINDSEIYENHFEENTVGVLAEGSTRIKMERNEFKNNGWALKIMGSCDNVSVNNNNFLNNTFDVATNTSFSENNFDGNYWDKYEGYDLNRDGIGDIPYRPISLYSLLIERNPTILVLFRSFFINLMDRAERALPTLTPTAIVDNYPKIKMIPYSNFEEPNDQQ